MRKPATGAICQCWVIHEPAPGVACPLNGGGALTLAGWEFWLQGEGFRARPEACHIVSVCVKASPARTRLMATFGLRCRFQVFRFLRLGFRVQGSGFWVWGLGVQGSGFGVQAFRAKSVGARDQEHFR